MVRRFAQHSPFPLFRILASIAIALACTSGCDRGASALDETVTLRFWNGFTGPDGKTMLAIVKQFNAANPDVHVIMQRMEWGTYYNKIFVANLGHRGPDVFVIHTDHIARFREGGFLRPSDDIVMSGGGGGIDANDIDANVWNACEHDGKHWTVPLDIHVEGMYFNKSLFKEAGIVDAAGNAKPPTNREEFLAAAHALTHDVTREGQTYHQWGFVFDWLRNDVYTLMRQNGGEIFNEDRTRTTLNSPRNIAALQFATDLIAKEKITPSPQNFGGLVGFRQGKVGMVFAGIFVLPDMQKQTDLDYGAAPIPQLLEQRAAWGSSHNLCVRPDLEGRKLEAAKRFVKFLSDNSLDWSAGGQIPVRRSLRESDRFQHRGAFADQPDRYFAQRAFAQQIPYAAYYPSVQFTTEYVSELDTAVERAVRLSMTPKESLDLAAAHIEAIMRRYGIEPSPATMKAADVGGAP